MSSATRRWTETELTEAFGDNKQEVVRDLFLFAQSESYGGQVHSGAPATAPKFNFYVRARRRNGSVGPNVAWECRGDRDYVRIFLNWQKYEVSESVMASYREALSAALGGAIDLTMREPTVPLSAIGENMDGFRAAVLAFRDALARVS
jgi:hypothetical protein